MEEERKPWSGLAIASLACGVLSLGLGFFAGVPTMVLGVPAIFCGHLGRAWILKSGGKLRGQLMALAGLTLGYLMMAFSILVPDGQVALKKANLIKTKTDAVAVATAVEQYCEEYGKLPAADLGSGEIRTEGESGVQLLTILMGREVDDGAMQNSRQIPFLNVALGKQRKRGGLIYEPGVEHGVGSPGIRRPIVGLFDAWGNPFRVILDDDYDEVIRSTYGGKPELVKGKRVLVASKGPDGIEGTKDDVKSW